MQKLEYKMIDGNPVSQLGFIVSSRCRNCFSPLWRMYNKKSSAYCSKDCKEENEDYNFLQAYKLQIQQQRDREKVNTRKEYMKEYAVKNKEKRREQGLRAMKKYQAKLKALKVARLKDLNK